jgi:hypothetical protein
MRYKSTEFYNKNTMMVVFFTQHNDPLEKHEKEFVCMQIHWIGVQWNIVPCDSTGPQSSEKSSI